MGRVREFVRSPLGFLCFGVILVAGVFLVLEHRPHLYAITSVAVLGLCLLMHFFHGGHGRHGAREKREGGHGGH